MYTSLPLGLQMIIKEALRLYPPAPLTARSVSKPLTIGGFTLPVGHQVFIPIWHVHRDECNWENPLKFDPERFAEGKKIKPG